MPSFRTTLTPHRRAAARFVVGVRRTIQKALADENKRTGLTQTAIAKVLGVHRSVINREVRGAADMTLGRVAELAWAMGKEPVLEFRTPAQTDDRNVDVSLRRGTLEGDKSWTFGKAA
jgi:hypothetical protein